MLKRSTWDSLRTGKICFRQIDTMRAINWLINMKSNQIKSKSLSLDDISVSLGYAQLQKLTDQDKAKLLDMAQLMMADVRRFPHPGTSRDSSAPPLSRGDARSE